MERQRNWLSWAALALAGLALLVAFGGRFGPGNWADRYGEAAPAASVPGAVYEQREREAAPFFEGRGGPEVAGERGPGAFRHGRPDGFGHGRGPGFFPLFGLLSAVSKLAALGLLVWLLVRLFNQRRNGGPTAPAPTTPAGHDPRVE